jgi:hypothetical protein
VAEEFGQLRNSRQVDAGPARVVGTSAEGGEDQDAILILIAVNQGLVSHTKKKPD